jgi:hypothetical protein
MASKKFNQDEESFFEDLLDPMAAGSTRFKVVVEFILEADGHEEAQAKIHELVKEGILAMAGDDERDIGYTYDITDSEIAEIDM